MLNERVAANQQMARSNVNKNEAALKIQRKYLYDQRDQLMRNAHLETEVGKWLSRGISLYLTEKAEWSALELRHLMNQHFTYDVVSLPDTLELNHKKIQKYLERFCQERLEQKAQVLINNEQLNQFYRSALLNALDSSWTDQMAYLSKLSVIVQPWATAQRDPKFMYQEKAYQAFEKMFDTVAKKVVDNLMLSTIRLDKDNNLIVHFN